MSAHTFLEHCRPLAPLPGEHYKQYEPEGKQKTKRRIDRVDETHEGRGEAIRDYGRHRTIEHTDEVIVVGKKPLPKWSDDRGGNANSCENSNME